MSDLAVGFKRESMLWPAKDATLVECTQLVGDFMFDSLKIRLFTDF
jgi:hypothetical protein